MATPSAKGGYDCQFVDPPSKTLECPVCLLTLRDPHVTTCCGNYLCEPCFLRVLADRGNCPLCNDAEFNAFLHKGVQREINALKVRCVHQDQGCEWVGELGYLQQHLLPSSGGRDGCGYEEEECRYKCGGRFQRRLLEKHESEKCPMRLPEVQFHILTRKLEAENQQLKEELVVVNQKLHEFESENQTLREESKQMKLEITRTTQAQEKMAAENQLLKQDIQELMSRIKEHASKEELSQVKLKQEKEMKTIKRETKALERETKTLESKCALLETSINPTSPFYFAINNFEHYKKSDLCWHSPPFYSHSGGYKLMVQLWPNGVGTYKGTHMSVFLVVMRGEYDDQLKWPFTGEVTVRMLNRSKSGGSTQNTGHRDTTICFDNSTPLCSRRKPEGCNSLPAWGYLGFISHSELPYNAAKNTTYLREDRVRFVVTKVELN